MAKDKKHGKQMDPQAMMEVYQKLATPGEPHKLFASLGRQLDDHDERMDGAGQAANGINRHRGHEDVAGWTLSLPGIHRPDDGTTLLRDRDRRLRQHDQEICDGVDGYDGYGDFHDGRHGQRRRQDHHAEGVAP